MNKSDVALCNCMHEHTNSTAKCTHMHIWCLGACSIWAAEVEGAMGLLHAMPYSNSNPAQCQWSPIMVFYVNHDDYNGQPDHNEVGAKEKVYFFHVKIYTGAIFTKNDLCIQKCMYGVTTPTNMHKTMSQRWIPI